MKHRFAAAFGPLLIGLLMLAAGLLALLPQAWRNDLLPARFDNAGHLAAFFIFSFLAALQWPNRRLHSALLLLFFGAAIEFLQLFTPTHSASLGDLARDVMGIVAGMVIASLLQAGFRGCDGRSCSGAGEAPGLQAGEDREDGSEHSLLHGPLVVDLDGTLLRSDLLLESLFLSIRRDWRSVFRMPLWLLQGKSYLKEKLAQSIELDVSRLPYNQAIVSRLQEAKRKQRQLVLATASPLRHAEAVARHVGLFDHVLASGNGTNLKAAEKRDLLVRQFGRHGFDYIGNSHADLPVWAAARRAYLADPSPGVERRARAQGNVASVLSSRPFMLGPLLKALRPHQWLKNILIFIPLLAAHQLTDAALIAHALLAFVLFSVVASAGYLFNDLLDLESDRAHPVKKSRPLASGELPIHLGIVAIPILFLIAFSISALLLPWAFTAVLAAYAVMTIAYSQYFKRLGMVDTLVLALLYTLRIIAGSFAGGLVPTFWILAFSVFLFLSLAMVKRYAELLAARNDGRDGKAGGRGYFPSDLEILASLGISAGYLSVLVLALYIQDVRTIEMYRTQELIWLACPILLFWINRTWLITHRGQMHDDPVLYAVKDRTSIVTGLLFATVFILAMFF